MRQSDGNIIIDSYDICRKSHFNFITIKHFVGSTKYECKNKAELKIFTGPNWI